MVKTSVQLVICVLVLVTIELCAAANIGESCTADSNCTDTINDSECSSGACKCIDATHYNYSNACVKKETHGGSCDQSVGDGTCLYSLRCTADICQCDKPHLEYFSSTACSSKIALDGPCTPGPTGQCLDDNAECKTDISGDKCLCKTNYKEFIGACVASHGVRGISPNLLLTVVCVIVTVVYKILK